MGKLAARRGPQRPGRHGEHKEEERPRQRLSPVAYGEMRGDRPRVVEDEAGIGPLLQTGKTRREHRDAGQHVPDAEDRHEVRRVA
jgi:hypothetical protein